MPNVKPYKPDAAKDVEGIERARKTASVTQGALSSRAGMSPMTYWRILKSGRATRQQITALRMSLRSLKREKQSADQAFLNSEPQ